MQKRRKYKYSKQAGALQESASPKQEMQAGDMLNDMLMEQAVQSNRNIGMSNMAPPPPPQSSYVAAHQTNEFPAVAGLTRTRSPQRFDGRARKEATLDNDAPLNSHVPDTQTGTRTFFNYVIPEGQHVLITHPDGTMEVRVGPGQVFRWSRRIVAMERHVAHPGEFLIVRYVDGRQEHTPGPAHLWRDPREHVRIEKEETLPLGEKEAIVVYSRTEEASTEDASTEEPDKTDKGSADQTISRRIVYGPASFVPEPGEWLHTFSWHGSTGGEGYRKVPNAMVFQKLWLLPDQMYHDIQEVRTADGVVLTIRLMLFFELVDVEQMLTATHDPIGDFVNAATSDVVDFVGKHAFDVFKASSERLNQIETYPSLTNRAELTGYRINKVVYRGYGAPAALQKMHDQGLESRTRLQLEKATQQQAEELEDLKQERRLVRAAKDRDEATATQHQHLALVQTRQKAELENLERRRDVERAQEQLDEDLRRGLEQAHNEARVAHLGHLKSMDVDLTQYLTQHRADRVIELRGADDGSQSTHLHLRGDLGK